MCEPTLTLSYQEKEVDEEDEVPSLWSQLLPELLSRVFSHVFKSDIVSIYHIPKLCKSWKNSFDVRHTTTLIRKSLPDPPLNGLNPTYPCLITLRGTSCKFYHPSHVFTMDFPELCGFYIRSSKFGWLLLSSFLRHDDLSAYSYIFFNPFTRQNIYLPPCDEEFGSMTFSSRPTSSDCYVIGLSVWHLKFGIIKRGEQEWSFYGSRKYNSYVPYSHLALCGDRCYAIWDESKILAFDLKRKYVNFVGTPFPRGSPLVYNEAVYLIENGAQMIAVIVPYGEQNIYIRRMTSNRNWLPLEALRNHILFVSKTSSTLKEAPTEMASNKIYFPKILNDDTFVSYCLATKKYISFFGGCDYASGNPWNLKQWTNSTWIETMSFGTASLCNQQTDW